MQSTPDRFIAEHNSRGVRIPRFGAAVHPRACGELSASITSTFSAVGSSPRVRGTLFLRMLSPINKRFIPVVCQNSALFEIDHKSAA